MHHGKPTGYMDGETLVEALMAHLPVPVITTPPARTWIWSDLHLGDAKALTRWDRPFRDVDEMNAHLLEQWEQAVGPDDTVICLGDVSVDAIWQDRAVMERLRECPGKRWLVLGNHDVHRTRTLRETGFDSMCAAAVYAADPPLALTHPPLWMIPREQSTCTGTSTDRRPWDPAAPTRASRRPTGNRCGWTGSSNSCGRIPTRRRIVGAEVAPTMQSSA